MAGEISKCRSDRGGFPGVAKTKEPQKGRRTAAEDQPTWKIVCSVSAIGHAAISLGEITLASEGP
jgi:hypothetical protein